MKRRNFVKKAVLGTMTTVIGAEIVFGNAARRVSTISLTRP